MCANKMVHPNCCTAANPAIMLCHTLDEDGRAYEKPPVWVCYVFDKKYEMMGTDECKFCPFCGQAVPEIQPRQKPPGKIAKITDGGYYCDTCGDRLNECECYPPEWNWEPVK